MTEEKRNRREREFISLNGAIMESLCLVKSHEITTVTASAYSTAEREETQRAVAKLRVGLVSEASFLCLRQLWDLNALAFLGKQLGVNVAQIYRVIKCMCPLQLTREMYVF